MCRLNVELDTTTICVLGMFLELVVCTSVSGLIWPEGSQTW